MPKILNLESASSSLVTVAYVPVTQMDRVSDFESESRRFESCQEYCEIERVAGGSSLNVAIFDAGVKYSLVVLSQSIKGG